MLSSVPKSEPLLLDAVPSAAGAWGLRKLRADYSGNCVKVRRSSDDTTRDVGFVNGWVDIADIESWAAGSNVFVDTLYDQSGNGANLSQATLASQPQIADSGVVFRDGVRPYFTALQQTLTGTLASGVACNAMSVLTIIKNNTKSVFDVLTIASAGSGCCQVRLSTETWNIWTRATPGGSVYQTGDVFDVNMHYSRWGISGVTLDGTTITIWRNDIPLQSWTATEIGASGTTVTLGTGAGVSASISEIVLYGTALSQSQMTAAYRSINQSHLLGPLSPYPKVILEERLPWDDVLREWMRSLTDDDITVSVGTVTWDETRSSTDELMRIARSLGNQAMTDHVFGLLAHNRFWALIAGSDDAGIEHTSTSDLRFFCTGAAAGTPSPEWATWYANSLPKTGGAEGNPFYKQRAVAIRALMQVALQGIHYAKNVDQSQDFYAYSDFGGGAYAACAYVFDLCREVLPEYVQNAFLDMLRYAVARQCHQDQRTVNANMEMKSVEMFAYVYSLVSDSETRTKCIEGAKQVLFGSPTGDVDTGNEVIWSPAGHIKEGRSPETTYNGQSLNHLIRALARVFGDSNWNFLQTVVDRMLRFKGEQYFVEPDGVFDGPSGYGGRTGGSRVGEQGITGVTNSQFAARSTYGRPFDRDLADEATLVSSINTAITAANTRFATSMTPVTGTAACHTGGCDTIAREFTVQVDPASTLTIAGGHDLVAGTPVIVLRKSGSTYPSPLAGLTTYWVVNPSGNTLQLAATQGGAAITLTTTGDGTYEIRAAVQLTNSPNLAYAIPASCASYLIGPTFCRYLIHLDDTNKLAWIDGSLDIASGSAVDYSIEYGPGKWVMTRLHWPSLGPYDLPAGYYDAQRARITGNDSSLDLPWELSATFNISRNDEFWLYKNADSNTREFGWMVEAIENKGAYAGWYGGTLQSFWTRDGGFAILARHDKSGDQIGELENTRVFSQIQKWATTHIYGVDSGGGYFSSACAGENHLNASATWDINGTPKSVVMENEFDNGVTEGFSGSNITGTFVCRNTFQATASGIRHLAEIEHTGTDNLLELWSVIPVYLRDSSQSMSDAVIQYWNGSTWASLNTSLVTAEWVRIGRDFGSGLKYTWINFADPTAIRLSDSVWVQSYQGDARIRNLLLDGLGYTGSSKPFPASVSWDYSITTIDPGLTPTGPSLNVTYPLAADTQPVNGVWAVQADVDWQGFTEDTVVAEYTTNGTDWSSIGSLTLASGSTYRYLGGTIPSSVQAIRVTATPVSGTPATQQVNVTSTTPTQVLNDPFTAANDTAINGSYSSWTTNTTGNVYVPTNGDLEVQSNQVVGTNAHSWGNSVRIDVNSARQIVEALVNPGTVGISPGQGVVARMNAYFQGVVARLSTGAGTTDCFTLAMMSDTPSSVNASYGSWNLASTYRVRVQAVGSVVIAQYFDEANSGALAATIALWNLIDWTSVEYAGFICDNGETIVDDFKVWTW